MIIHVTDEVGTPLGYLHSPPPEAVEHPAHYNAHPSGVECITIAEHFNFNLGNAIKYIWRAGLKGNAIEDLKKAHQYLDFEIQRISKKNHEHAP